MEAAKHKDDLDGALFRPVKNNISKILAKSLHPNSVYRSVVKTFGQKCYAIVREAWSALLWWVASLLARGSKGEDILELLLPA